MGLRPATLRYFDVHHSASDTLEKVHPREVPLGAAALAIWSYAVAEQRAGLPRVTGAEVPWICSVRPGGEDPIPGLSVGYPIQAWTSGAGTMNGASSGDSCTLSPTRPGAGEATDCDPREVKHTGSLVLPAELVWKP